MLNWVKHHMRRYILRVRIVHRIVTHYLLDLHKAHIGKIKFTYTVLNIILCILFIVCIFSLYRNTSLIMKTNRTMGELMQWLQQ